MHLLSSFIQYLNHLVFSQNKNSQLIVDCFMCLATSYSCRGKPPTTIGAKELNFRVRYGNGCDLFAIITRLAHGCAVFCVATRCCELSRSSIIKLKELFFQNWINVSLIVANFLFWLSPRSISIRQLHVSPHFHLEPIYLIVFEGSYLLA